MDGHHVSLHDDPRLVEVLIDGTVVASSNRTVLLEETGLPARHYFPRDDVRMELLAATPTETVCPFKGQATYWSVGSGDDEQRDVVWSYEVPIDGVERIAGHLCFYVERTEHRIDGAVQERPETPWTPRVSR